MFNSNDKFIGRLSALRKILGKVMAMVIACTLICSVPAGNIYAQKSSKKSSAQTSGKTGGKSTAQRTNKGSRQGSGKGTGQGTKKKGSGKSATVKSAGTQVKKPDAGLSSAELRRQEQSAQAEVKKTQEELKKNEAEVKRNLNELSRLEDDIAVSKKESSALSAEVGQLSDKIGNLETKIAAQTKELERLRSEYLKAVKKMRVSRKRNSGMSYLFSAKNLAQAERRMRYLKEFSEWKDRQTKDIQAKIAELSKANAELKQAKSDKDVMLGRELKVQNKLSEQKQRQNVVIAELKANGTALKSHLAKKQSEVNALRNQVAAVIAEEQRKAEAERRKREEAARAEQERIERQKAAEEQARIEREAKEQAAREAAEKAEHETASNDKKTKDKTSAKDQPKKPATVKETGKKDNKDTGKTKDVGKKDITGKKDNKEGSQDYAKARNRKPRGETGKNKSGKDGKVKESGKIEPSKKETPGKETPSQEKTEKKNSGATGGNFANSRGALPRPVSGAWRVTGKFGRHALPDLPDVIYDNPGIDVEVSKGATVKSVFGGEVSGVYVVPGFSTVIIVHHGDYYTVYGNIGKASVKVGDNIRQGQAIGTLTEDADNPGRSSLHFEVWKGREKLNPQSWIQ